MTNWFEQGGQDYARFRPEYPRQLAESLAALSPERNLALDVGCGSGQLTTTLATMFDSVIGIDPSADQLANAVANDRVRYLCAPAERLPVGDHTVSLITAAQAAHWFDRPAFYEEVRRVAVPNGILALASYGVLSLDDGGLQDLFLRFYSDDLGTFWPPERRLVDENYRTIDFPFPELEVADLTIGKEFTLGEFLGYVSTWSAVRNALRAGRHRILTRFSRDLEGGWGDPEQRRLVTWPVSLRAGRVG